MKITFLLPHAGVTGGVRVICCIAECLKLRGHEVAVISLPRKRPKLRRGLYALLRGKYPWGGSVRSTSGHPFFSGTKVSHHVIDRHRPIVDGDVPDGDWVVAGWFETAHWAARLSESKGRKAHFIQQYDANFLPECQERVDAAWRLPLRKIVCAQWLSELGERRFGTGPLPIVCNGIDTALFDAPPRFRGRPPKLGFLYSRERVKGLFVAREVIARVRERISNLQIVAFGSHYYPKMHPLPGQCEFHLNPAQEDLKKLYAKCDVWLCCSESEGFHLPTHEAMACRCPVVSTRVGGPMDMIGHGIDGFLAHPGNVEELAEYVTRILTSGENEWTELSRRAYEKARRYSWPASASLFEQALLGKDGPER